MRRLKKQAACLNGNLTLEKDDSGKYVPKGKQTNETLAKFADFYSSYARRLATDNLYDFDDVI